jgi:hypothetical protein
MTVNEEMILYVPEFIMKDVFYEYTPAIIKKQTLLKTFLKNLVLIMLLNSVA